MGRRLPHPALAPAAPAAPPAATPPPAELLDPAAPGPRPAPDPATNVLPMSRGRGRDLTPSQRMSLLREEVVRRYKTTPLEFFMEVMTNPDRLIEDRLDAAKAAAPYIHPKLAMVEVHDADGKGVTLNLVNYTVDRA